MKMSHGIESQKQTKKSIPKTKKEIWKEKIRRLKDSELTVANIADIIKVSPSRIYSDLESKRFEGATKKGTGKKSHWDFTHDDAISYIESFDDNIINDDKKDDKTPPSKQIPFPGWDW